MMKKITMIILSLVVLLLASCSASSDVVDDVNTNQGLGSLDVITHPNEGKDISNEYNEVDLYITNGGFSPAVVNAKRGQTIVVLSNVADASFSIDELGIFEELSEAGVFEFSVHKSGEYPFICVDCSPMIKGLLVVE
jgi:plastocyanin